MSQNDDKRAAARVALTEVRDGMLVGIGTGSTVAHLIAALGERRPRATFFATSLATARALEAAGIAVADMAQVAALDLAIDGADEIDPSFRAIKGGGGAMLREKVVAAAARRFVVIADGTKRVAALGAAPVPVETLPFARALVAARLEALGAAVSLRGGEGAPFRTDNGNAVLDAHFGAIADPPALAAAIAAIPGALGHGLFLSEVDALYVADRGVVTKLERSPASR